MNETFPAPFHLPLDAEQFRAALEKGQGRALMHLKRYGGAGFEDPIIDACLEDQRYDTQCESERTEWLVRVLGAAELDIVNWLLEALTGPARVEDPEVRRDRHHRCRLALHFAEQGNAEAQAALYGAFCRHSSPEDLIAVEEIIELDGADGLIHVAERMGNWIREDEHCPVSDSPIGEYDGRHGDGSAERILWSAARYNQSIAWYVMRLATETEGDTREVSRFLDLLSMTVKEIIHEIESGDPEPTVVALRGWGRSAGEHELKVIAGRMFGEKRPDRLVRFLSVFQSRAMPRFDRRMVRLADHEDADVRRQSMWALSNHRHPAVRSLALDRADQGRNEERELRLFRENYVEGDWPRIESALELPEDIDRAHSLLSDLIDIFGENPGPDAPAPLLLVYEHSRCTICRESAVDLLLDGGQAPAWLLKECRHDCDKDIRNAVTSEATLGEGFQSEGRPPPGRA